MEENKIKESELVEITLKLRKAEPSDFKAFRNGEGKYLFGKMYFYETAPGKYAADILRNNELSKEHFSVCYNAQVAYVIDNANEVGWVDING